MAGTDDSIKSSNDADLNKALNGPELSGPRVQTPNQGDTGLSGGSSLEDGYSMRESIASVTPEQLGMDTIGDSQMHMQAIKESAGRGTKWG